MYTKNFIKLGCAPSQPFIADCFVNWPQNCSYPGIMASVFLAILRPLGFQVQFVRVDTKWEIEEMLINGSLDLSCSSYRFQEITAVRNSTKIRWLITGQDQPVFVIRDELSDSLQQTLLFQVSSWKLWLLGTGILLLIVLIGKFLNGCSSIPDVPRVQTPNTGRKVQEATKTSMFLVLTVIFGVFSNFLAIGLNKNPGKKTFFADLSDLSYKLLNRECRFILSDSTKPTSSRFQFIDPTDSKSLDPELRKRLHLAYRVNPPLIVKNQLEAMATLASSKSCLAAVEYKSTESLLLRQFCGIRVQADAHHAEQIIFTVPYRKSFPNASLMSAAFTAASIDELFTKVTERYANRIELKRCKYDKTQSDRPLTTLQLSEAMWILLTLCGGSFIALAVEIIHWRTTLSSH